MHPMFPTLYATQEARTVCDAVPWCDTVHPRAENSLPSSINTPAGAVLLNSEALNVLTQVTQPAHSVTESVSDNDSERDGEEDDDDSDNDLEIVVELSGTADSTDDVSGGTDDAKLLLWS
jgi:hypothetical protein